MTFSALTHSGVEVLREHAQLRAVQQAAQERGAAMRVVDTCKSGSREDLMTALANALSFPDYFGRNWDAVDECLRHLKWLDRDGVTLCFPCADHLLRLRCLDLILLVKNLARASAYWGRKGVEFTTLMQGGKELDLTVHHILTGIE